MSEIERLRERVDELERELSALKIGAVRILMHSHGAMAAAVKLASKDYDAVSAIIKDQSEKSKSILEALGFEVEDDK